MPTPFFYFKKLETWDKVTMSAYVVLTATLWYYFVSAPGYHSQRDILFNYAIGTHLFLYFFNYKSLRNLTVYFFWIGIGILHLFIYLALKDVTTLLNGANHSAKALRNTIILLLLFQVIRFISLTLHGHEMVCPSKYSRTDLFFERRVTTLDVALFLIYLAALIYLAF